MYNRKEYHKNYYQEHKKEILEKQKKHYQENKEERIVYNKKWRENNPEKVKEGTKKWRLNNPEKYKKQTKIYNETHKKEQLEYRQIHKKEIAEHNKQWVKDNPEYQNEYQKEWSRKKRTTNLQFKLSCIMGNAIYKALKENKAGRHWESLVGYTLQELAEHLEARFDKNMNWQNQGSYWHIDHIKPKSLFKFDNVEDIGFKECWKLSNLQPLEAIENLRKGKKYY